MFRYLIIIIAFTALLVFPAMTWAQPGPGGFPHFSERGPGFPPMPLRGMEGPRGFQMMNRPWWNIPEVQKRLELTPDQVTKLNSSDISSNTQSIQLDAQKKIAEIELQKALEQTPVDRTLVDSKLNELMQVEKKLRKLQIEKMLTMKETLTPDQLSKIQKFMEQRRQEAAKHFREGMRDRWQKGPDAPKGKPQEGVDKDANKPPFRKGREGDEGRPERERPRRVGEAPGMPAPGPGMPGAPMGFGGPQGAPAMPPPPGLAMEGVPMPPMAEAGFPLGPPPQGPQPMDPFFGEMSPEMDFYMMLGDALVTDSTESDQD